MTSLRTRYPAAALADGLEVLFLVLPRAGILGRRRGDVRVGFHFIRGTAGNGREAESEREQDERGSHGG